MMATGGLGFNKPPTLDIHTGNVPENFRKWKQQLITFIDASELNEKPAAIRSAIILNLAGEDVLEISNHFVYGENEDKNSPDVLLEKIEKYCSPKKSEVYESYKFWITPLMTPIDHFVAELRTRAKTCNFGNLQDRLIRDKIIFSITEEALKSRLLREQDDLPLHRLIDICRAHETAQGQLKEMALWQL